MAVLFLSTACTSKTTSDPADDVEVEPERVWARRCASCHGPGGEGDGPMSPTFAHVSDLTDPNVQAAHSDDELRTIITKGYKRMPPVRNLSDMELNALVNHVRVLGGAEPAPSGAEDPVIVDESP